MLLNWAPVPFGVSLQVVRHVLVAEEETVVSPPAGRQDAGQDQLSDERLLSAQLLGLVGGKYAKECASWAKMPSEFVPVGIMLIPRCLEGLCTGP